MTTYTNPTGTFNATNGDDSIIFDTVPASTVAIDALGGHDSLLVQFDYFQGLTYDATDVYSSGSFMAQAGSIIVYNVESVEFHGTSNNDTFHLQLGTGGTSGLTAIMDGGAGDDLLKLDWSKTAAGMSFVVNGSSITSSWGTFSNFEQFEIRAGSGNDTITTGSENDNIYTGTGVDVVHAGAGNDYIYSESSGGSVDGGDGIDIYGGNFSASTTSLTVSIGSTINISNGIVVSNVEGFNIGGGSGDDIFNVTTTNGGYLDGGAGHDTLTFSASAATTGVQCSIQAYAGDQLDGSIGPISNGLTFYHFENVQLTGSQYNDQFQVSGDYSGSGLSLDAGAGIDSLSLDLRGSTVGTTFNVAADGSVSSNRGSFSHFESFSLSGGSGADHFVTGAAADGVNGGAGSDYIDGGAGDDYIVGSDSTYVDDGAADTLIGGLGNDNISAGYGDTVDGGSGTDELYYIATGGTSGINANFATLTSGGTITVAGATLAGIESIGAIWGTNYADTIVAGKAAGDSLQIFGEGGDDHLTGSSGNDVINGGAGSDTITGGLGADILQDYEGGNTTFIDTAAGLNGDTISGLQVGDKIVITDANIDTFTFTFNGANLDFSGGSLLINSQVNGKVVASAAPGGGVQLTVQAPPGPGTIDQIANQLTSGYWNGDSHHFDVTQGGTITVNISTLNASEQTLARTALAEWGDIIGVQFQEVSSGGQIVFDDSNPASGPVAATDTIWSNGIISSSNVHISSSWVAQYGSSLNSYSFQTYVHEIGHALGLGHAGDYNFHGDFYQNALFANDSYATSVMSYFDQTESPYFVNLGFTNLFAVTPMQADIVAMQSLYGLSTTTRTGDTVYGFNSNADRAVLLGSAYPWQTAFTIYDSGGNDTLDYSGGKASELINLNPETYSNVEGYTGNLSIARGVVIENAITGDYNDTILGNSVANVLTGNLGSDKLTGGAGNDTFKDTAAGHNGDTITDFSAGDKIVITDASLSGFSYSLSGNTLNYTGGSLTLTNVPAGHLFASAAAEGGVQLALIQHDPANDFNGDGRSDVLWRNASTGQISDWLAAGTPSFTDNYNNARANVSTGWTVAGTGDFNGDGRDDILWRNTSTGQITDWLSKLNGGFTDNFNASKAAIPLSWTVAGIGDFNGDGHDDILWRSDTGVVTDWLGSDSGAFTSNYAKSAVNVPADWHIVGTGDFNGDGRTDILWRSGTITVDWLANANGGFTSNWNASLVNIPTDWTVVGTGDFNGDGKDDILWRNSTGLTVDWLANASGDGGFSSNYAHSAVQVATSTSVASIGDFNGDGRDDILWRTSTGAPSEWFANSSGGFTDHFSTATVPTAWHVEPHPSFV